MLGHGSPVMFIKTETAAWDYRQYLSKAITSASTDLVSRVKIATLKLWSLNVATISSWYVRTARKLLLCANMLDSSLLVYMRL